LALTEKQKRFADEYLIDLNATRAAERAGYKDPNIGRQLITKNNVSQYIQQRQKRLQKKIDITQERVLAEIAKVGFADITDFLEYKTVQRIIEYRDGKPVIDWAMMVDAINSSEVDGAAISEISVSKDGTFKFKLHSKLDALDKLGRHLGLFDKQSGNEHIESGLIDSLQMASERIDLNEMDAAEPEADSGNELVDEE